MIKNQDLEKITGGGKDDIEDLFIDFERFGKLNPCLKGSALKNEYIDFIESELKSELREDVKRHYRLELNRVITFH